MISYKKLLVMLTEREMKKTDLKNALNCSPTVIANISKNRYISMGTIDNICKLFDCQPGDILEYIPDPDV